MSKKWLNRLINFNGDKIEDCLSYEFTTPNPRIVISGDSLRLALHGQVYAKEAEGYIACMMEVMGRAYLAEGYDVLWDETCTTKQSLERVFRLDRNAIPIWMHTSEEECIKRAKANNQEYLIPVIKRCEKQKKHLLLNWVEIKEEILDYLKEHN